VDTQLPRLATASAPDLPIGADVTNAGTGAAPEEPGFDATAVRASRRPGGADTPDKPGAADSTPNPVRVRAATTAGRGRRSRRSPHRTRGVTSTATAEQAAPPVLAGRARRTGW
jgi:hypothetical protein